MKNILLIIAITFVSLADAQADVVATPNYKIEVACVAGANTCLAVYCMQNYVFIEARNGSLVQMMEWVPRENGNRPMKCKEWKKSNTRRGD